MRVIACSVMAVVMLASRPCVAQSTDASSDNTWHAAPLGTPPLPQAGSQTKPANEPIATPINGRPDNRWRYRFSQGRWWYWAPVNQWSYFDGTRWLPYRAANRFSEQRVDPALLRLEAKEGVLGPKKWRRIPGTAGGLPMSGTQGTAGGNPSGSFTDPGGVPSAVNTTTGSYFGYGERIGPPVRHGK